jgi:hypothetical protein
MDSDESNVVNNDIDKKNEKYDWWLLETIKINKSKIGFGSEE